MQSLTLQLDGKYDFSRIAFPGHGIKPWRQEMPRIRDLKAPVVQLRYKTNKCTVASPAKMSLHTFLPLEFCKIICDVCEAVLLQTELGPGALGPRPKNLDRSLAEMPV